MVQRIAWMAALGAAGLALGGCADRAGYGGGLGYAGYYGGGYEGDYGPAGYDAPYGFGDGYAFGFGWYDGFYYPGTGIYVYDRYRRPYRWTDGQRRYWQGRSGYGNPQVRSNWQAFGQEVRGARQDYRQTIGGDRQALQAGTIAPDQYRADRQAAGQAYRQTVRQDYGTLRQQNQAAGGGTPRGGNGGGGYRGGGYRGDGGHDRR